VQDEEEEDGTLSMSAIGRPSLVGDGGTHIGVMPLHPRERWARQHRHYEHGEEEPAAKKAQEGSHGDSDGGSQPDSRHREFLVHHLSHEEPRSEQRQASRCGGAE
jgi:hypothetical protein